MVGLPNFPSVLIEAHIATGQKMEPGETVAYIQERAEQGREIAIELVVRIVQSVSYETAQKILEQSKFKNSGLEIPPERLELESMDSLTRRRHLSPIAKDIERNLGRQRRHSEAAHCRELLSQGTVA